MDTLLLKWHMKKRGDNVKNLADHLGIAASTLYLKLRGESDFTQSEIQKISKSYRLAPEDVVQIFFSEMI